MFTKNKEDLDDGVAKTAISKTSVSSLNNGVPTIMAPGAVFTGELKAVGTVEIACEVHGNVSAKSVTIRKDGNVKGDIMGEVVVIDGTVHGTIKGTKVRLSKYARVIGTIVYNKSLSIEDGAHIEGKCQRSNATTKNGSNNGEQQGFQRNVGVVSPSNSKVAKANS